MTIVIYLLAIIVYIKACLDVFEMFTEKQKYLLVNAITFYRLISSVVLIGLIYFEQLNWFRWLLFISFFTDFIDGTLARYLNVHSTFGAKLDSIADDVTVLAAIIGLIKFKLEFLSEQWILIIILLFLFLIQLGYALVKYRKTTSFHTYLAKVAAIAQGVFLILIFFIELPVVFFYVAAGLTILDLIEEIILVFILPEWKANVKGIYWILKK